MCGGCVRVRCGRLGDLVKAVVLHQPYATLVALGVKTIETRPSPPNGPMRPEGVRGLPGLAIEPGERIAIVAGKSDANFSIRSGAANADGLTKAWGALKAFYPDLSYTPAPPLGAVVCTVVVAEALPMIDGVAAPWLPWMIGGERAIGLYRTEADVVGFHPDDDEAPGWQRFFGPDRKRCYPLEDQLPYGDFAPGRWGWLLADVKPTTPIPCKGKQGVFRLPDDIAEALS